MSDEQREKFERLAKELKPNINLSKYDSQLMAQDFGRNEGDYCGPKTRDLWEGFKLAYKLEQPAQAGSSEKLIHIGYTDENHIERAKSTNGRFYPGPDGGQYIPVYMLARHLNRLGPDANPPKAVPPEGIVTFEKGDTYKPSDSISWRAGISTTTMRESLGGSYEDLEWANRIEVYGDSRAKANNLRDYVLSAVARPRSPKAVPEKLTVSQCVSSQYCQGYNDAIDAMLEGQEDKP